MNNTNANTVGSAEAQRAGGEQLITVTASAARKLKEMLTGQGHAGGVLRLAVEGGGCSGYQYTMVLQETPSSEDILVQTGGISVAVDAKSASYLAGSEIDFVDALQNGGFKVKNPNAKSSCSCGESFCP